ncbi:DsbA family protein [Geomonas sp.]|uniref:DsbA family protein n=1 Tax=Geomonas sp. TaxID=2651584 RepID=UPI002B4855DB|nr:DsbA family protein [Geomonas sp.]HJV36105.1 DsbA family protein [Geomonas sp.]
MFCIISFLILAVMGIFSASSRELAKQAWGCVFRRVTLRPCTTGFDERMKSRILGSVINRSETAARLLSRNFELLSWTMFVLMVASTLFAARGVYLFYVTGNCSGSEEAAFCLLDPTGENVKVSAVPGCPVKPVTLKDLTLHGVNLAEFPTVKGTGKRKVVLIGCYGCGYTRKVYWDLKETAEKYGASFTFLEYPVMVTSDLATRLGQCVYRRDPAKYWQLNDRLFSADVARLDEPAFAKKVVDELGINWSEIQRCLDDPATEESAVRQMNEVATTNFFGTPTVFIDGKPFVGPKPHRVYAIAMNGLLYWLR